MKVYSCYVTRKAAAAWEKLTEEQQYELAERASLLDVEVLLPRERQIRVVLPRDLSITSEVVGQSISYLLHKQSDELRLAAKWAKEYADGHSYRLEVPCAAGRIDIMLDYCQMLVEAKYSGGWKAALGQAICYRCCFPNYKAALVLIGKPSHTRVQLIEAICKSQNVHVYWID
jgi:hypothetical protein